ncbi:hypothetical protein ccbrp13_28050 [Ktedonobacteria bacterium brp13]|nr:hypothetical protein ccbrp13_28050 [Ktedonobacteria bacterium brp13]
MPDIDAPINAVTIYNDRAQITRIGSLTLEAGEHVLRINGLPQFQRDSLRASGRGPQGARILNIDVSDEYHARPPEAESQRLQAELAELTRQWRLLEAQQEALEDRRKWLRALGEQSKDFARGIAQGQMKAQECADFFQFMTAQASQDAEAALNLKASIQQAHAAVKAKEREYNQRTGNVNSDRLTITVTIDLTSAGEFTLEVTYIILGAAWHPTYDVRVQQSASEQHNGAHINLTYYGIVEQYTGEDWHDVALSLSTARPSKATIAPEIIPWYLRAYTPLPTPAPRARSLMSFSSVTSAGAAQDTNNGVDEEGIGMVAALAPQAVRAPLATMETTTIEQSGTALVFRVGRNIDIPSDNSPHKTTIAYDEFPCAFDYVCAPGMEELVHVRGIITNTSERVLLPGEAQIFMESEYVGSTRIKQTANNEQFKIFLGIDDSIKVTRKLIEHTVDKGGILLQNDIRRTTYAYRITVHNYAQVTKQIVVRDRLPIPQNERIKVRTQSITPQPTERTKLEQLTWEFALPTNGERSIEYHFTVEYPGTLNVMGLPSE